MLSARKSPPLLSARHKRAIAISVLLAGLLYLLVIEYVGHSEILNAIGRLDWAGWSLILACSLTNYGLRFIRWHYYIRQCGQYIGLRWHFIYYLAGFALTTTPGKAGETIRSVFLRPHGVPYPTSLACFFVERFMDVLVVAGLSVLTLLAVERYTVLVLVYSLIIVALVPVIRSARLRQILAWVHQRFAADSRARRLSQHVLDLLDHAQHLLKLRPLYLGFAIGLLAWGIQGIAFYSIASAVGFAPDFGVLVGIYAISLLAGAASFVPGGLGTTEAAMVTLMVLLGAEATNAWAIALISRVSTLWFAVALGLLANGIISARGNGAFAPAPRTGTHE